MGVTIDHGGALPDTEAALLLNNTQRPAASRRRSFGPQQPLN